MSSVASASLERLSVPFPTSGMATVTALPFGETSTWIGSSAFPEASAFVSRSVTADRSAGSEALPEIATTAGVAPPGNAASTFR